MHLLKVLLDDDQGLASGLIERAGGDTKAARAETSKRRCSKIPIGFGRRQPALSEPRTGARVRHRREARRRRPAIRSSRSSGCCWRW